MNIELLKKAAEWIGIEVMSDGGGKLWTCKNQKPFNPDKETGRHFLVEMEKNFCYDDAMKYVSEMRKVCPVNDLMGFCLWFKTAPAKLCFKTIMDVMGGNKNG